MENNETDVTRRHLFVAGGLGLVAAAMPAAAQAAEMGETEKANVKLVQDFIKAWADDPVDPVKLGSFMAEDCSVKLVDNKPPAIGREAAIALFKSYLTKGQRYDMRVQETFARGPVVVNTRIDGAIGAKPHDSVGLFYIKDGKIKEWNDYYPPRK